MRCLGIIGGMSWESTALYYQQINQGIKQALGGLHSANLLLRSVDFAVIEAMQMAGDWSGAEKVLVAAARQLQAGGAQALVLATNTMHKVADGLAASTDLPLLHIADATGQAIHQAGFQRVALLGTAFTMEQTFYKARLTDKFGVDVQVPDATARADIHRVIYQELCQGTINPVSRARYIAIAEQLHADGAQAIILGCTEIGMLLNEQVTALPLIDTTRVHVAAAVNWMLMND